MKIKVAVIFTVLMGFLVKSAFAQYTEIGFGGGFATYWGDLNATSVRTNFAKNSGVALQLHGRKIFKNRYGVRIGLVTGQLKGNDAFAEADWQKLRNLSFKSNITEVSLMGEYYIFGFNTEAGSTIVCPYATVGASFFRFDPSTIFNGNEVRLQPLGTEGQSMPGFAQKYSLYNAALNVGGGIKFIISENLNIGLESVIRRTFTDYIDDVSTNYVNYNELKAGNGTLAANLANRMHEFLGQSEPVLIPTGSKRGGAKIKDYYLMSLITINVSINQSKGKYGRSKRIKCPTFK